MDYIYVRDALLKRISPIGTEQVPLALAAGRILAKDLSAREPVPAFDRSAYDGYAFRAADAAAASPSAPVTLRIIEEVPAGRLPTKPITAGTAAKILTGAPIPTGADAVIKYESTDFTEAEVTLFSSVPAGGNIVRMGEDIAVGAPIAAQGSRIDAGLAGMLAAQGITGVEVYRRPVIGILSTGSEIIDPAAPSEKSRTRDANRSLLAAVLAENGFLPRDLHIVPDDAASICAIIEAEIGGCDALLLTGGVSAGDYDVTPLAMERAGAEIVCRRVSLKPGMACAYGFLEEKPILALSGNPASAFTNLHAIALPLLRRLAGHARPCPPTFPVTLAADFKKRSPSTRLLRGTVDLSDGTAVFRFPLRQGNAVLTSAIGCDAFAIIPAGSDPLPAGTVLSAFWI